jgi:hypothetical protein
MLQFLIFSGVILIGMLVFGGRKSGMALDASNCETSMSND